MKTRLFNLIALFFLISMGLQAQTVETLTAADKSFQKGTENCGFTAIGDANLSSSGNLKMPKGGTCGFTIQAKKNNITKIEFTWVKGNPSSTDFTCSKGAFASNVWTGDASSITFMNASSSELKISQMVVYYGATAADPSDTPTPSDDPSQGDTKAQDVVNGAVSKNVLVNQMVLSRDADVLYYNSSDVKKVAVDDASGIITITTSKGNDIFYQSVKNLSFAKAIDASEIKNAEVKIKEAAGWLETVYAKWELSDKATSYKVYIKGGQYADYTEVDHELIRKYADYGRVDVPGLKAGSYSLKVVPVASGVEGKASEISNLAVQAHDRTGFAHWDWKKKGNDGIGAYKDDGSLKEGAKVLYITANNAKTISTEVITGSKNKKETLTGLQTIIEGYKKGLDPTPLDIRIIGKLTKEDLDKINSSAEGLEIKGASAYQPMNITLEGIGEDATIWGFGFLLRNVAGVEMRNLGIMCFMDDGVSIDTNNSNLWIHNLDIFYGSTGGDSDQAKGDGSLDLKADSKYITCSYNRFWDSGKASLCGMTSESGPNWITYHHNWFDHADSRLPRIRTMSVHVFNNYYDNIAKYGVGAAQSSNAFVENNYFYKTKHPMMISLQGTDIANDPKGTFSGENGGMIKAYNNYMDKSIANFRYVTYAENNVEFDAYEVANRNDKVPADVKAKKGGRIYDNWDTDNTLMYTSTPDAPELVPGIVTGNYGAGRINHGDFEWTFEDNTGSDAHDAALDTKLKSALVSYQTTFQGFFEK